MREIKDQVKVSINRQASQAIFVKDLEFILLLSFFSCLSNAYFEYYEL